MQAGGVRLSCCLMLLLASRHFLKYREPLLSHIKCISWCHLTRFSQGVNIINIIKEDLDEAFGVDRYSLLLSVRSGTNIFKAVTSECCLKTH